MSKSPEESSSALARIVLALIGENGHLPESDDGRADTKHLFLPAGEGTL